MEQPFSVDALLPAEIAEKAENAGVSKVNLGVYRMMALAVLAGSFIGFGAIFATTVTTGAGGALPYGVTKFLGGFAFCLGLILVVLAGAELFTGNNLIVMAWMGRKVTTRQVLRSWVVVYVGNFIGSMITAVFMFFTKQYTFANGAVGLNAINIANSKVQYDFIQAVMLGVFCNALVCLAIWLCMGARTATDKILAIIFPITAFVAVNDRRSTQCLWVFRDQVVKLFVR